MIKFPIIEDNGTINQFIDCWSRFYNYGGDEMYFRIIKNNPIKKDDIRELFKWKNGMRLAPLKDNSLETKIVPKLELINALKNDRKITFQTINENFKDVSAIWRIFLAHIIKPDEFPIFDQHVYRSMIYLQTNKIEEMKNNNQIKLHKYEHEYLKFFNSISLEITDYKKYDEAMWVFGKFLKQIRLKS